MADYNTIPAGFTMTDGLNKRPVPQKVFYASCDSCGRIGSSIFRYDMVGRMLKH